MCLYPKLIKNPKYTATKKNGGNIPAVPDERVKYVPIGCGKCLECMKQKANAWRVRLLEDLNKNTNGKFVTLTFSNESYSKLSEIVTQEIKYEGYDLDNAIATYAVRHFCERHRKKHKQSIRHWLVTELGHENTEHLHIHGIIWTDKNLNDIEQLWKYGYMWKGKELNNGTIQNYVNEKTIGYITKYVNKTDSKHKLYKPIILCSKGIGNSYLKRTDYKQNLYNGTQTKEYYKTRTGHKIGLPIYYRNKIYTEKERELLWLQKLDKQERWVLGNKIDISKGEENYEKALKYAQQQNTELGYGGKPPTWEQEQYERERRKLKQLERIKKKFGGKGVK